jgi:diaminopimelate epimerase
MKLKFSKYTATGNDFIVIDNREATFDVSNSSRWEELCQRRKAIGADGVLFLENSRDHDFAMRYLNADGKEAEMCGNGARAIAHFYAQLEAVKRCTFETQNSVYNASIDGKLVSLEMSEISEQNKFDINHLFNSDYSFFINTGVPHAIYFVKDIESLDVVKEGKKVRESKVFKAGTNVNFVEIISDGYIKIRTYERGVEDETLSCGTGVLAASIAYASFAKWNKTIKVESCGGILEVKEMELLKSYKLIGDAHEVYSATTFI